MRTVVTQGNRSLGFTRGSDRYLLSATGIDRASLRLLWDGKGLFGLRFLGEKRFIALRFAGWRRKKSNRYRKAICLRQIRSDREDKELPSFLKISVSLLKYELICVMPRKMCPVSPSSSIPPVMAISSFCRRMSARNE